nr:2-oxoacid:ferredoxin oxidoreductase subunit beta [Nocardioides alcanivorans]
MSTTDLGLPTLGTTGVPTLPEGESLTGKDFTSDQEVRWCPGCGDYAVLKAVQSFLPTLNIRRENVVFISGIGCSSRFPYYLDTYGMHSIHGRAPSIATGLAVAREDLHVFVVTGDGDALSIGGNHLIHALRRNVNMTILLFNNRIYGLTKGQYSPTSEIGKITKSTPVGSLDHPFNPVSLALGAEGTFVARTIDSDRKHLTSVLTAATAHRGTSLVEIYQNCPIFNDGAFDAIKNPDSKANAIIPLVHDQPITFGTPGEDGIGTKGLIRNPTTGNIEIVDIGTAPGHVGIEQILIHDAHNPDPSAAFAISRLTDSGYLNQSPIGIFRQVERPAYDDLARAQITTAKNEHTTTPTTASPTSSTTATPGPSSEHSPEHDDSPRPDRPGAVVMFGEEALLAHRSRADCVQQDL